MTWTPLVTLSLIALGAAVLSGTGTLLAERAERAAEAAYPPEGRILNVDGVPVHAAVSGTGPDLVIIHGANGNTRDWTFEFARRMADRYRVIVFDRPGAGYTGRVDPAYAAAFSTRTESPAEQAALLAAAARQIGADAPVVVGHSYGGAVALAWALGHPLSALVPVAAVSNVWQGEVWPLYRVAGSRLGGALLVPWMTATLGNSYVTSRLGGFFAPDPVPDGYADYVGAPLSLRRESIRATARQIAGLKPLIAQMAPRYASISVPTEIVHGQADTAVPLAIHSARLADQIPGARLTVLDGVGHMVQHARPEAVDAAIERAAKRAGVR